MRLLLPRGQLGRMPAQKLASLRRCSSGFRAARLAAAVAECAPARDDGPMPLWLERELRSNHAGETGAVWIYRGARAALRVRGTGTEARRQMARVVDEHESHEREHLEYMERILPPHKRTVFEPLWVAAGFVLGLLPSLLSPRAFYLTTEGVETFVEQHYGHQIARLREEEGGEDGRFAATLALLEHCCAEELEHKEDAAHRASGPVDSVLASRAAALWSSIVMGGSQAAVVVAKRF